MKQSRLLVLSVSLALPLAALASFINYSSREINVKLVYYGPETAGLSENLQYIYGKTSPDSKGKLISLSTETDRTLFFDFLPLSLGEIRGFKTRFHLYTVPGKVSYEASRKLILKGVDGIVFVADADPKRAEANLESWKGLERNLAEQGYDLKKVPLVLQVDTRRYKGVVSAEGVAKQLGAEGRPVFLADPTTGVGVFDSLKAVAKLVLLELKKGAAEPPATKSPAPPAPAVMVRKPKTPCGIYADAPDGGCQYDRARAIAAIRSSSLTRHAGWIERRLEPTVWMTSRDSAEKLPLGASRLGGLPDVPAGFTWPLFKGKPLELVAQLRMADAASAEAATALPKTGWLAVFCPLSDPDWFAEPKDGSCRVVHFDAAQLQRMKPPSRGESAFERANVSLRFEPGFALRGAPSSSEASALSDAELGAYDDLAEAIRGRGDGIGHHLQGPAQAIQDDPRLDCVAAFDGIDPKNAAAHAAALKRWTLLLQLDSDGRTGWMFGDDGSLYFLVRKRDLAARKFDEVCTVMQSY